MTAKELRQKYLDFFVKNGHKIIPAAPLVPENDPTTLFTSSGMQQLGPYLKGEPHPLGKRLTNSQPSLRLQDIEEVGDTSHTTFFEMLGNWSLGDYFKKEQLTWIFEFLTYELRLPKEKLYVSVFEGTKDIPRDDESYKIWQDLGIPKQRIFFYGPEKNWWSRSGTPKDMPPGEIGGPDSEVFYDFGSKEFQPHQNSPFRAKKCHPNCQCGRFLEIGNSVFIQYQKNQDGSLQELPQKNVDFGGGLERLVAATINNPDIFQIELFSPMIYIIEGVSGKKYEKEFKKSFRIMADHLRAATFLINDGVEPSNVEQGYILRRLIRRAIRHGRLLGINENFTLTVAQMVIKSYAGVYFELAKNQEKISEVLLTEEEKFKRTLNQGLKEFNNFVSMIQFIDTKQIPGERAFYLYESFGFPLELTIELAQEKGFTVDQGGFEKAFAEHQKISRIGAEKKFAGGLADHSEEVTKLHTATHLLHQALRMVLGEHVCQSGSNITSERLRFDFPNPRKLTEEELKSTEELVNRKIKENLPVKMEITTVEEAKKKGAIGLFEEKYGGKIKVYTIGNFSKEICGGPHVNFTGSLGRFKIIKEEAAGAGVRRIYATLNFK